MVWGAFHERQLNILKSLEDKHTEGKNTQEHNPKQYIIWTSGLTAESNLRLLSPSNYTIQIWTDSTVSNMFIHKVAMILNINTLMFLHYLLKFIYLQDMNDNMISHIVNSGFDMIFSNADALYLDCGYGAWVGSEGQNWCSPYKGAIVIWSCLLTRGKLNIL